MHLILKRNSGLPAHMLQTPDAHQLTHHAIGLVQVSIDLALETQRLGDKRREIEDADISPAADLGRGKDHDIGLSACMRDRTAA